MRLLLIEDDVELCRLMEQFFGGQSVSVDSVHDGPSGLAAALGHPYDLVLLDVMLPGFDGFTLLEKLREQSGVPVIMLTARTASQDKIRGLENGADDYLPKPFAPDELLARIRAVLRRAKPQTSGGLQILEAAGIRANPATREAWSGDDAISLTAAEFDILELLLRHAGAIVSRDAIANTLYQREATPFERSLDVHISNLRKKLGSRRDAIVTIRGAGYQLAAS